MRVLVVDDEPDIVELISYNLRKEGLEVTAALNGEDALSAVRSQQVDIVVLDLMLPGIGGLDLCRLLRSDALTAAIPIIMLTARTDEIDRVVGLETGADDYVTKPFSPRELAARVKAVLRRTSRRPQTELFLRIGDLVIDRETYTATKRGERLDLSSTEFRMLLFLAERRGKVFTRDMLLDAVWRDDVAVEPRSVDVYIRRLRMHIEDDPANPVYLKTRRGIGYYMETDR